MSEQTRLGIAYVDVCDDPDCDCGVRSPEEDDADQPDVASRCQALVAELAEVYTVDTDQVRLIGLVQKAQALMKDVPKPAERSER